MTKMILLKKMDLGNILIFLFLLLYYFVNRRLLFAKKYRITRMFYFRFGVVFCFQWHFVGGGLFYSANYLFLIILKEFLYCQRGIVQEKSPFFWKKFQRDFFYETLNFFLNLSPSFFVSFQKLEIFSENNLFFLELNFYFDFSEESFNFTKKIIFFFF